MGIGVIIAMDSPACLPAWIECMREKWKGEE
jgi:hypothetical protein